MKHLLRQRPHERDLEHSVSAQTINPVESSESGHPRLVEPKGLVHVISVFSQL